MNKLANIIRTCGLVHLVYRNDKEPALRALVWDAAKLAGIKMGVVDQEGRELTGEEAKQLMAETNADIAKTGFQLPPPSCHTVAAVPEESHPDEPQSNGAIERAIKRIEDQARTLKLALGSRIGRRVPMNHPLMAWLLQHAATLLTHVHEDADGPTAYGRLHGATFRDEICELGETMMYYIPARNGKKMDPRWQLGIFLGRAWGSNQNFIGKTDGNVAGKSDC